MYSFSGNCAASVPISTLMCLWAMYIFPGLVRIFPCNRIGRPILENINLSQIYECWNCETEHYNSVLEITVSFMVIHNCEPNIYIGFSPALHLQWGAGGERSETRWKIWQNKNEIGKGNWRWREKNWKEKEEKRQRQQDVEGGQAWKGDRIKRKAQRRKGKQVGREKSIGREETQCL